MTDATQTADLELNAAYFDDALIEVIVAGARPLTPREREWLVTDTPRFEECQPETEADLRKLSDSALMRRCYEIWADYVSGQI